MHSIYIPPHYITRSTGIWTTRSKLVVTFQHLVATGRCGTCNHGGALLNVLPTVIHCTAIAMPQTIISQYRSNTFTSRDYLLHAGLWGESTDLTNKAVSYHFEFWHIYVKHSIFLTHQSLTSSILVLDIFHRLDTLLLFSHTGSKLSIHFCTIMELNSASRDQKMLNRTSV